MLQKPILSGRVGKWAYALVEYDLHSESIGSMKGQIVADFIVQHRIDKQIDIDVGYITFTPWKLHLDGSACRSGCGVGIIIISPSGAFSEALSRLGHKCTNNQVEYEALLFGLQILHDMGVKHLKSYGDSLLVVQQVSKVCHCLNGYLNAYLDKCLDIISYMDEFVIYHVPREGNPKANALAQQASGYNVQKRNFQERKPMFDKAEGYVLEDPVQPPPQVGQTGYPGQTAPSGRSDRPSGGNSASAVVSSKIVEDEVGEWRTPLVKYLQDPKTMSDKKSDDGHISLFYMGMNCIVGQRMICF
jgi:ribonuclease HI/probable phosphoglycerate mutase